MIIAVFSDLHLPNRPDPRNALFEAKLREFVKLGVTDLWLLGDIFDLMVGPYSFWRHMHAGIFAALRELTQNGCRVLWLEGNHDFHMQGILRPLGIEPTDAELPLLVGARQRRVFVAHGDLVNLDDKAYLKWRGQTRNIAFRAALSMVPSALAKRWLLPKGEDLSYRSRRQNRDPVEKIHSLYRAYADQKFNQGFEGVFLGHCHVEDFYRREGHFYLNLGSWIGDSTQYALWDPDTEPFPKVLSCRIMKE